MIRNPDEPEAHERAARGGAAAQPLESQNPKKTGAPAGARAVNASSNCARGHYLAAALRWQEAPIARAPAGAPAILGRGVRWFRSRSTTGYRLASLREDTRHRRNDGDFGSSFTFLSGTRTRGFPWISRGGG